MLIRIIGRLLFLFLLLGAALLVALWRGWLEVAPRYNPWAPLDVRETPNLLTPFKLWRLGDDRELCDLALATSGLRFTRLADSAPHPGCPVENAVRIQGANVGLSSSFMATCPLAVSFALFERHGLQPAAQAVFGQPVSRVEHVGSFTCRSIAGSQRPSQHSYANALDMVGFRLRDGQHISVLRDWPGQGDKARFLRLVQEAACDSFNVTLGPEYNAAHRDHFHVDMGMWRMCR
ncbi:extensin family protein [Ectopseudomonas oleovorans]|uniref:Extensin n=2 Tax=Ectopseudomonas oleovorans TaxID=301 RepID=A0A379JNX0_ECTOL|nr:MULTISPECIES: extensin family protein [Pseudomonas]KFJ93389.1 extensin [Pseudomonas sp. 1-7]MBN7119091.1 extensin [Pseudomonas oleovorans]MBN7131306.1 extensin [Pseudomonas oleovorans]MBN7142753.1 extensin [Pseudomonas oleovorans]MDH1338118.1 extensin family protein [Pseudomonas oleovorans]